MYVHHTLGCTYTKGRETPMETFTNAARNTLLKLDISPAARAALEAAAFVPTRNYWEVALSTQEVTQLMAALRAYTAEHGIWG